MKRSRRSSRALFAGLGVATLVATLGLPGAAAAPSSPSTPQAPAALDPSRPFGAAADSSLLRVDLPSLAGTPAALLPQTNVDLAHSTAAADSDGDVSTAETGAQRTGASAATTGDSALLGAPLDLASNEATAPPSEANEDVVLPLDLDPLLSLDLIETSAIANWVSDTECVSSEEPLSLADQTLADLSLIGIGGGQSVAALEVDETDGAADTEVITALPANGQPNDGRNVQASAATRLSGVNVLNGITGPDESVIDVEVVQNPDYTVVASGQPGGAAVIGDDPVVNVSVGGSPVVTITAGEEPTEVPLLGLVLGDLLSGLDVLLAPLQPVVRLSIPVTKNAAADGTSASVSASLLLIEILPPDSTELLAPVRDLLNTLLGAIGLDITQPLGTIELAPIAASVQAPAGGIFCGGDDSNPVELQKINSGPAVAGSTFDYTIAVGNVGDCTLNPVRVEDTLLGPAGTTIVSTEPAGATVTPIDGGFSIVWENVGPIAPDGRTSLRIRVAVPANATPGQRYTDTVTASTTCDGRPVTRTVTLNEPPVIAARTGPCNISGSTKSKSHLEVYPGESFIYFINVFNAGGDPCTGVTITDALDPRVTFESCSDGCTVDGRNVAWALGTVASGQSITLRVQVKVNADATGSLANAAIIDTNETPEHPVQVSGPDITTNSVLAPNGPAFVPNLVRTGGSVPVSVAAGLGLLAVGFHFLRRRVIA